MPKVAALRTHPLLDRSWFLAALLFGSALLVFVPSLFGPYVFDDRVLISGNHYVHDFSHWTRWFRGSLVDSNYDLADQENGLQFWRPLVLASFAANWSLGSGATVWFHATNLVLHGVNVLLLWGLFRRWFRTRRLAFVLAAAFALHPAQTEVVCWISGRGDSLCCFGLLVALHGMSHLDRRGWGLAFGVGGATFAFLSKETAVVLPAFVLMERWTSGAHSSMRSFLRKEGWIWGSSLLAVALYLGIRSNFLSGSIEHGAPHIVTRIPVALETLGRCLELLAWPFDTTLGQAAVRSVGGVELVHRGYAAAGGLFLASGSVCSWLLRRRAPGVLVGWICFLVAWLPVSGLVSHRQLALISPRYLYIPFIPFLFAVGSAAEPVLKRSIAPRFALLAVIVLSVAGVTSFRRSRDYSSTQSFWKAEILANPHYVAAQDYFVARELAQQRPRSALKLALHFLQENRRAAHATLNQGLTLQVIQALLEMTPDTNRKTLGAVSVFCDNIVQGRSSELVLPELGVHLAFNNEESERLEWHAKRRPILLHSADALSRLGHDEAAFERLSFALQGCDTCWLLFTKAAFIRARALDIEGAQALIDAFAVYADPRRRAELRDRLEKWVALAPELRKSGAAPALRATYFSGLEAYGRAYQAARDAFRHPPPDSNAQRVLAEIALRAGDIEAARAMVERFMGPHEVTLFLETAPVPWRDAESPPNIWIPSVL